MRSASRKAAATLTAMLLVVACTEGTNEASTITRPHENATASGPVDRSIADEPETTAGGEASQSIEPEVSTTSAHSDPTTTTLTSEPGTTTTTLDQPSTSFITVRPDGVVIRVEPYARLADVPFGTEADEAIPLLIEAFGDPDIDSGWVEGCPLDGGGANERNLTWGSLQAQFYLSDTGRLTSWIYDAREGENRPEAVIDVDLPGGVALGDAMSEVASAVGIELLTEGAFDGTVVSEDGYTMWGFPASSGSPLSLIGVPFVPFCE